MVTQDPEPRLIGQARDWLRQVKARTLEVITSPAVATRVEEEFERFAVELGRALLLPESGRELVNDLGPRFLRAITPVRYFEPGHQFADRDYRSGSGREGAELAVHWSFWATELGQYMFLWRLFPRRPATRQEAAAVLGISYQAVTQNRSLEHLPGNLVSWDSLFSVRMVRYWGRRPMRDALPAETAFQSEGDVPDVGEEY